MYKLIPLITTQRIDQVKALQKMHSQLSLRDAVAIVDGKGTLYQDSGIGYNEEYFALEYVGSYVTSLVQAVSTRTDEASIIEKLRGIIEEMADLAKRGHDVNQLQALANDVAANYSIHYPTPTTKYKF